MRVFEHALCEQKRRGTYFVSRNKVPDEEEDGHDDVLGDRDDIRAGDFQNLDVVVDSSIEVDVVRADTGRNTKLQVLGLQKSVHIAILS